jgi:EAL domain-containing protein (putative c-di-GMP-specific phosphodiesterase class I)
MVKCMVELAHGLGLTCTAEGVETADQLAMLCKLRCDVAQGYLIAQPLEPDALGAWLEEWTQRWPTYAALEPAAA